MTGIEVCGALRADPSTADVPIILLTAKGQESELDQGLAAGADDYMVKPFSPGDLLVRVTALLAAPWRPLSQASRSSWSPSRDHTSTPSSMAW